MSNIRAAIIGTGSIANAHAEALKEIGEGIDLVGCMDVAEDKAKEFTEKHSFAKAFTDVDQMLDTQQPDVAHHPHVDSTQTVVPSQAA